MLVSSLSLFILWLLLSGHYTPLLLSFGVASSLFVSYITTKMEIVDLASRPLGFFVRYLAYLPWIIMEIIKSNLYVARILWLPKIQIQPQIIHAPAGQKTDLGMALHANSITLTPGTLSLDIGVADIEVHALTDEIAAGLADGEFDRRACAVEGGP